MQQYFINKKIFEGNISKASSASVSDALVGNKRYDKTNIEGVRFELSTFANISFREAKISSSSFQHCVFMDCYFRNAEISTVDFTGTKFINCNFNKTRIRHSEFDYCEFKNSVIPFEELQPNFPPEHNLRRYLCRNLKVECRASGALSQYLKYFYAEMAAVEEHIKNIVFSSASYYKKYSFSDKIGAFFKLCELKLSKKAWGYGERLIPVAWISLVLAPLFFGICYWFLQGDSGFVVNEEIVRINFPQAVHFSYANLLNLNIGHMLSNSVWIRALEGFEALLRAVLLGVLVAVLYRKIDRR